MATEKSWEQKCKEAGCGLMGAGCLLPIIIVALIFLIAIIGGIFSSN